MSSAGARPSSSGLCDERLYTAVSQALGQLIGADAAAVLRFEPDETITLLAAWSRADAPVALGDQQPVNAALRRLRDSGRAIRCGPFDAPLTGPFSAERRRLGIRAAVAVPVQIDGRVWGINVAGSRSREPFPPASEARMVEFARLLANALANAGSGQPLLRLAEQQAGSSER